MQEPIVDLQMPICPVATFFSFRRNDVQRLPFLQVFGPIKKDLLVALMKGLVSYYVGIQY